MSAYVVRAVGMGDGAGVDMPILAYTPQRGLV